MWQLGQLIKAVNSRYAEGRISESVECLTDGVFAVHESNCLSQVATGMRICTFRAVDIVDIIKLCDELRTIADFSNGRFGEIPDHIKPHLPAAQEAIERYNSRHPVDDDD